MPHVTIDSPGRAAAAAAADTDAEAHADASATLFPRRELARDIAAELMSGAGQRGMLLSGPRQTGKSTFVQWDLVPALVAAHGAHVVYIDLSADGDVDPAVCIEQALREEVKAFDGLVMRVARSLGLTNIRLGGLEMEVARAHATHSKRTLGLLQALARAANRPLVVVIDEVQLCQQSEAASRLLVALTRSASRMNREREHRVRVLATGSHAHKLHAFLSSKRDAFHGAKVRALPPLDAAFLDWLRPRLPERARPEAAAMSQGFDALLRRPQELLDACDELRAMHPRSPDAVAQLFQGLVEQRCAEGREDLIVKLRSLPELELALVRVLAETGYRFAPHMTWCRERTAAMIEVMQGRPRAEPLTTADIEAALDQLAAKAIVWRGFGIAFEEPRFVSWILAMDPATDFRVERDEAQPPGDLPTVNNTHSGRMLMRTG
ncbi:ATP-binding protein [Mitsuaria sp. GD03876]|uniref:ATP-binding protein n=1 Tax=Mitsuaria sp. GD03876 TaxID=2975399 RepID=UPI002449F0C0|nr:ATP-binding protein [Mitsuaria sp. GD03876]MDH0867875.1 ATP-binding protein [Mitsuaria sp. GD03876]